jgi:hypothetical protein
MTCETCRHSAFIENRKPGYCCNKKEPFTIIYRSYKRRCYEPKGEDKQCRMNFQLEMTRQSF